MGNTGMSVHELKSLFKDHKPLPDSVDEMLQRHFPKTIFSETKKHADLADKCGILEAISPILQLDGAIESLGHHIEHLLQADHMSDAEQKRLRQHFLRGALSE